MCRLIHQKLGFTMDFHLSNTSDYDLKPSHHNKFKNRASFAQVQNEMEIQIHQIEQEAYGSVLRAFKAQSEAITWEMESLITELRKELNITDGEHRKLLTMVNGDILIGRIREWRKTNGLQPGTLNCPPVSAPLKKQKTSVSGGSDPLIGKKVWTRRREDNNFYEAVIHDFNPLDGRHALVYEVGTPDEAWKWVNLREVSPHDIRWKRAEDVGISHKNGQSGLGHEIKKPLARCGTTAGFGRELPTSQNGIPKKVLHDIQILHTETLVKEVDKVFSSNRVDPLDIEKARKLLKEHEQALVDAIAKLEAISDGESDREHRYQ